MENSLVLAMPSKAAKAIKPPLKKAEIIEALARRKFAQLVEANKEYEARCQGLNERINAGVAKLTTSGGQLSHSWSSAVIKDAGYVKPGCKYYLSAYEMVSVQIALTRTISVGDLPPDLRKLVKDRNALEAKRKDFIVPEYRELKADVRDQVLSQNTNPVSRIDALLKDPATLKVLDRTLAELDKPSKPAAIAA